MTKRYHNDLETPEIQPKIGYTEEMKLLPITRFLLITLLSMTSLLGPSASAGPGSDPALCPPEAPGANAGSITLKGKIVLSGGSKVSLKDQTLRLYERPNTKSSDATVTTYLKSMLAVGGHWFTADTKLNELGQFTFNLPEIAPAEYELQLVIDGHENASNTFQIEAGKNTHDLGQVSISVKKP